MNQCAWKVEVYELMYIRGGSLNQCTWKVEVYESMCMEGRSV